MLISKYGKNVTFSGCVKAILLHKFIKICSYLHMTIFVVVAEGVPCATHVRVRTLGLRHLEVLRVPHLARTD